MEIGYEFNNIKIKERIAVGGMGEVFLALQKVSELFERYVVLKNIKKDYIKNPLFIEMFFQEAKITAKLMHENIVQVYDLNKIDEEYYILMEYIDGKDLFQIGKGAFQKKERIPLPIIIKILEQTCQGLMYAHNFSDPSGKSYNIVHRDISLQNIMVTRTGVVKLLDFGVMQTSGSEHIETFSKIPGKANYMSPEMILGKDIDGRSDIFSLGIVFYQMLTGRKPFRNPDLSQLMDQILQEPIEPVSSIIEIPKEIDDIIMKMLAKNPENRYQSAGELQIEFEEYIFRNQIRVSSRTLQDYLEYLFHDEE
ncbi:serine/threonine protein kinase [bacterium]|nr:serine/threonine protein kinase [bacterium]